MEFFGILHCVQDDSNYKTAATATTRRLQQQLQDGCNSNCKAADTATARRLQQQLQLQILLDDKQNGNSRLRGRIKSNGSGRIKSNGSDLEFVGLSDQVHCQVED